MPNTNTVSYIDTTYYTSAYKPNIRASILDKYLNGPKNAANFNAYAERATEAVNRLTNNTIEGVIGGLDLLPTTPKALVQKATAALVEYWFIQGYNLGQINTQISNSIVKGKVVKTSEKMREFIPETVLWLLQTSGLTDQTFIGAESDKDLMNNVIPGFTINDFFTKAEQLALFQEKGDYDNNFHKDVVIQGELTGTASPRYFLIGKSQPGQTHMSFGFLGGNKLDVASAKQLVTITKEVGGYGLDYTESSVVTLNPKATEANVAIDEPDVFAGVNANDEIEVYIETKADQDVSDILITDITPDDNGEYGLFSSSLNLPDEAFILGKYGVVQSAGTTNGLQTQIDDIKTISDNNTVEISKISSGSFVSQTEFAVNTQGIATNKTNIATNLASINTLSTSTIPSLVNTKIDTSVANDRFIHKNPQTGSDESTMAIGYQPTYGTQQVATANYVNTEDAILNRSIADLEGRLSGVEAESTSTQNWIDGNFALTGDTSKGTWDASSVQGAIGSFVFTSGSTIIVSVYDATNGVGGSAKVVVGKTNPQSISLANGNGISETVGVQIDTNGIITITESTAGVDVATDIAIDRLEQIIIGNGHAGSVSQAQLFDKQDKEIGGIFQGSSSTVIGALNENYNNALKALTFNNVDTTDLASLETKLGI